MIVAIAKDAAHHTPLASIVLRVGPAVRTIADGPALRGPVVAVAPDGSPVVAWSEYGIGTVAARPDGGGWTRDVVSHAYQDGAPDLGVDAGGTAHLAIERDWTKPSVYTDNGILVATSDGGDWTTARVGEGCGDDGDGCGMDGSPTFGVDSAGHAHVAGCAVSSPTTATSRACGTPSSTRTARGRRSGCWRRRRACWRRTSRPARPTRSTSRSCARTPATRASTTRRTRRLLVATKVAALGAGAGVTQARVQVAGSGNVDVAWAGPDGVFVATRSGGTWGSPVEVSPDPAGSVDLVRSGADRHLVFGRLSAGQPAGVAHALSVGGGPWTIEEVDDGADATPRLAVDGDGHVHVAYLRTSPEPQVRYATNAGGGWDTLVVTRSWTWVDPAFAVDAAGHHHVAVGADRDGARPLVRHGRGRRLVDGTGDDDAARRQRRAGGRAGRDRVHRLRGVGRRPVGLARDGHAGRLDADEARRRGRHRHPRHRAGRQRVAPRRVRRRRGGQDPIAYARTPVVAGSWRRSAPAPRPPRTRTPRSPSTRPATPTSRSRRSPRRPARPPSSTRPTAPARGCSRSARRGAARRRALDRRRRRGPPAHRLPRAGSGVRLQSSNGSTWTSKTVSTNPTTPTRRSPSTPPVTRTCCTRAAASTTRPATSRSCSAQPGLRWWHGRARRRRGPPGHRLRRRRQPVDRPGARRQPVGGLRQHAVAPRRGPPRAPAGHGQRPGRPPRRPRDDPRARLGGARRHVRRDTADTYRLQDSVNGGGYATVGPVTRSTSRVVLGEAGFLGHPPLPGHPVRRVRRAGRCRLRADGPGFAEERGGGVVARLRRCLGEDRRPRLPRRARATRLRGGATATWTFTGREVAWVAAKGRHYGRATVTVDGVLRGTVDLDAAKTRFRRGSIRATWGVSAHLITIRAVGDGRVDLDGFELLR